MGIVATKMKKKVEDQIQNFWPDIQQNQVWNRNNSKGFATIPKGIALVIRIINGIEKGASYDGTYLGLWCRGWDSPLIDIGNTKTFAHEAGFSGVNPDSTWRKRMRNLEKWGFIKSKKVEGQEFRFVLLMNPYKVIKKLKEESNQIDQADWDTLNSRLIELGADDLK